MFELCIIVFYILIKHGMPQEGLPSLDLMPFPLLEWQCLQQVLWLLHLFLSLTILCSTIAACVIACFNEFVSAIFSNDCGMILKCPLFFYPYFWHHVMVFNLCEMVELIVYFLHIILSVNNHHILKHTSICMLNNSLYIYVAGMWAYPLPLYIWDYIGHYHGNMIGWLYTLHTSLTVHTYCVCVHITISVS